MECHSEFMHKIFGAPQDVSRPVLEDLLNRGYTEVLWQTNTSATDGACLAKNNDRFDLFGFLQGLMHDSPIFEKTHVGCHCQLLVTGPNLPDTVVNAFGVVSTAEVVSPSEEAPVPSVDTEPIPEEAVPPTTEPETPPPTV